MDNFLEAYAETGKASQSFEPCMFCQRTFNPDVLSRHEKACENITKKKRKAFDSSKQRLEGVEGAENKGILTKKALPKQAPSRPAKKSNWRRQHEEFIANIRAARGASVPNSNGKLPPPPAPSFNPDYVQCPCCNRRFNQHAAERHIEFCKEQQSRIARKPSAKENAKSSLSKRTQYKPPLPGKKNSTGVGPPSATNSPSKTRNPQSFGDYSPSSAGSPTRTARALSGKGGSSSAKNMSSTMATSSARRAVLPPDSTPQRSATESSITRRSPSPSPKPGQRHTQKLNPRNTEKNTHQNGYFSSKYRQQNTDSEDEELKPNEFKPSIKRTGSGTRRSDREGSGHSDRSSSGGRHGRNHRTVQEPRPDDLDGEMWSVNPIADRARLAMSSRRRGSGSSDDSVPSRQQRIDSGKKLSKFCHMCGTQYPVQNAKFCCECGVKRLAIA